jgi:hypothetical protein
MEDHAKEKKKQIEELNKIGKNWKRLVKKTKFN